MGRQHTKLHAKRFLEGQTIDTTERSTHENRHADDLREPHHQRDVPIHGKTTHETKHETDFSRDKEPIRMEGQSTRTDTKTTFENQWEIANHGKTTHETEHENGFFEN